MNFLIQDVVDAKNYVGQTRKITPRSLLGFKNWYEPCLTLGSNQAAKD